MAQGSRDDADDLQIPLGLAECSYADVDSRGIPLIFSQFSLRDGWLHVGAGSRESSCDRVSIAETVEYDSEVEIGKQSFAPVFDRDGFPVLPGTPIKSVPLCEEESAAKASEFSAPLDKPCAPVFDRDGFPVLPGTQIKSVPLCDEESAAKASEFSAPLDPNPKRRKQTVLDERSKQKLDTPKTTPTKVAVEAKAKATPTKVVVKAKAKATADKAVGATPVKTVKNKAKATPEKVAKAKPTPTPAKAANVGGMSENVLFRPKLTVTSEEDPRAQLTASAMSEGKKTRVHVCTVTMSSWGPKFAGDMKKIFTFIETGTVTKDECLTMRKELKLRSLALDID
jgi:hypothetical protein